MPVVRRAGALRAAARQPGAGRCRGGGGRGGRGGAYTPPADSKELKDVLYNWTWHMGMLRSGSESELIKTMDYYGASGSVQVNGQPCTLTKYHLQANYQIPGYRIEIGCTRANKQTYTVVENMSGDYAWDDDIPGAELVPGKGKSTPRQDTLIEAAHPPLGQPARRAQGRTRGGRRACIRCSRSARIRPPCSTGRPRPVSRARRR